MFHNVKGKGKGLECISCDIRLGVCHESGVERRESGEGRGKTGGVHVAGAYSKKRAKE
jgi:hypothetical protein